MNFVVLVIDALRQDALTRSEQLKHVCKKNDCAIFPNTISASTITVPSLASIHTGLYPPTHGLRYQKSGALGQVPTLAEKLVDNGFRTMACAYTVAVSPTRRTNRGFKEYIDLNRTNGALFEQEYWTKVCEWWGEDMNKPSYLFLHTLACHAPYDGKLFTPWDKHPEVKKRLNALPPEKYAKKYWTAVNETFEFLVSPAIDYLLSIRQDTKIFILGDHGELLSEHPGKVGRLMRILEFFLKHEKTTGHGHSLTDLLVRVPLIAINVPEINSSNKLRRTVDLAPTIMELLGAGNTAFHGYSLKNAFAPEIAYSELMDVGIFRITTPDEKCILHHGDKIPQKFESFMKEIKEISQTKLSKEEEEEVKKRLRELGYL